MAASNNKRKYSTGFSLIELMVVISITSVLVSLSIPFWKSYRIKSIQTEKDFWLRSIQVAQETYFGANDTYTNQTFGYTSGTFTHADCVGANPLGLELENCLRLSYYYTAYASASGYGPSYTAEAVAIIFLGFVRGRPVFSECPMMNQLSGGLIDYYDQWIIDRNGRISTPSQLYDPDVEFSGDASISCAR